MQFLPWQTLLAVYELGLSRRSTVLRVIGMIMSYWSFVNVKVKAAVEETVNEVS